MRGKLARAWGVLAPYAYVLVVAAVVAVVI
jgi:hypothetical protein